MITFTSQQDREQMRKKRPTDFKWSVLQLEILISDYREKANKSGLDSGLLDKDPKYITLMKIADELIYWKETFDLFFEERKQMIENQKKVGYKIFQMELEIQKLKENVKSLEKANENLKLNINL